MRKISTFLTLLALALPAGAAPVRHHAKLMAASAPASYMFIAYGDTRSHPEDHRAVIGAIVKMHPEFVLQSGDLVASGGKASDWTEFAAITAPLHQAGIAYYPARGNHDVGPYYAKFVTEPYDSGNKYYYAFSRHGSRFIILDSLDPGEFAPASAQYQWLVRELQKAQKTALNTFVMFHEGPFSVGPHGPTPDAYRNLHPLMVKYHPRAVFCGHDHLYYRTVRDGVTYMVTGGGGAPLYDPVNRQIAISGDVYASVHHVIRCDVDGSRVTFTAISLDGSAVTQHPNNPSVTIVRPGGSLETRRLPGQPGGTVFDKVTLGPK